MSQPGRPAETGAASSALWVFGYGSLMWNPGFEHLESVHARLDGYARSFHLASHRYRGTPDSPGLVLGLDWQPGAHCHGIAFRVCPSKDRSVRDYLHHREMVTRSYIEVVLPITLMRDSTLEGDAEERVDGLTYILDRTHPQYAGRASPEDQARIIATAQGPAGPNRDYLMNTAEHLREMGLDDPDLFHLAELVEAIPPDG